MPHIVHNLCVRACVASRYFDKAFVQRGRCAYFSTDTDGLEIKVSECACVALTMEMVKLPLYGKSNSKQVIIVKGFVELETEVDSAENTRPKNVL